MTEQQHETNENLAYATFIPMFAVILQAAAAWIQLENPNISAAVLYLLLALVLAVQLWQSGIIEWANSRIRSFRQM